MVSGPTDPLAARMASRSDICEPPTVSATVWTLKIAGARRASSRSRGGRWRGPSRRGGCFAAAREEPAQQGEGGESTTGLLGARHGTGPFFRNGFLPGCGVGVGAVRRARFLGGPRGQKCASDENLSRKVDGEATRRNL